MAATALDAVRVWSADAAREVEQNLSLITDTRGLPIPADTPVTSGSILRLIPVREHASTRGDSESDVTLDPNP